MKKFLIRTEVRLFNYFTKCPEHFTYRFTVNSLQDVQQEILKEIMDYAKNFCYELEIDPVINCPELHNLRVNRNPGTSFFTIYAKFGNLENEEKIIGNVSYTINDIIMIADKGRAKND